MALERPAHVTLPLCLLTEMSALLLSCGIIRSMAPPVTQKYRACAGREL
jgi:hypothetical protein